MRSTTPAKKYSGDFVVVGHKSMQGHCEVYRGARSTYVDVRDSSIPLVQDMSREECADSRWKVGPGHLEVKDLVLLSLQSVSRDFGHVYRGTLTLRRKRRCGDMAGMRRNEISVVIHLERIVLPLTYRTRTVAWNSNVSIDLHRTFHHAMPRRLKLPISSTDMKFRPGYWEVCPAELKWIQSMGAR